MKIFVINIFFYYKTQYEDIFIKYAGGFDMQTGKPRAQQTFDNPIAWQENQVYKSEPPLLTIDERSKTIKTSDPYIKQYLQNKAHSTFQFGTVDVPAHFNSKIDYTVNHIYEIMTTSEINTLTQICELERTQILTILSLAQTNPYMAGFLLTGNRSNFVHIEGASLWLYECQHHLSPLYTNNNKCFDKIPIFYQDTVYYVDPISRQTYSFSTEISCDGNPANIIALDPDGNDYYLPHPNPSKTRCTRSF